MTSFLFTQKPSGMIVLSSPEEISRGQASCKVIPSRSTQKAPCSTQKAPCSAQAARGSQASPDVREEGLQDRPRRKARLHHQAVPDRRPRALEVREGYLLLPPPRNRQALGLILRRIP
jgi:hypothetical protein